MLVSKAGVVNHLGLSFSVLGVVRGAGVPGEALRWPLPEHTVLAVKVHALVTCNSRTICLDLWPIKQQSCS